MKRFWLTLLLVGLLSHATQAAQGYIVIDGLTPGRHYVAFEIAVGSDGTVTAVPLKQIGNIALKPPVIEIPPPDGFRASIKNLAAAVPAHDHKDRVAAGLSAVYMAVSAKLGSGEITAQQGLQAIDEASDVILGALDSTDHWTEFRAGLKVAINNLELQEPNDLAIALVVAAEVLSGNQSVADLLPMITMLIDAIVDPDRRPFLNMILKAVISILLVRGL
jgi:hypothetical protein